MSVETAGLFLRPQRKKHKALRHRFAPEARNRFQERPEPSRNADIELAPEAAEHVIPQVCVRLSVLHSRSKVFVNGCLFDRWGPINLRLMFVQDFPGAQRFFE
jgi:hypothetical protein